MPLWRILMCIAVPPLAVLDRGCAMVLVVSVLTAAGWLPGAIAALYINFMHSRDW